MHIQVGAAKILHSPIRREAVAAVFLPARNISAGSDHTRSLFEPYILYCGMSLKKAESIFMEFSSAYTYKGDKPQ